METRRFPLSDLKPNPFRNLDAFPVREENVEALLASFRQSGVWADGQLIVRLVDGEPEICAGHARVEAMLRHFGPDHQITVTVEDVSDDEMLRRMTDENEVRRQHSALLDQEVVSGVVRGYAAGRIELEKPSKCTPHAQVRDAPSFVQGTPVQGTSPTHPYTASTVAKHVRWDATRARDTLRALELIEQGHLDTENFRGQSCREARDMVCDLRKALQRANGTEGEEKDATAEDATGDTGRAGNPGEEGPAEGEEEPPGPPPEATGYLGVLEAVVEADDLLQEVLPDLGSEVLEEIGAVQAAVLAVVEDRHEEVRRLRGKVGS